MGMVGIECSGIKGFREIMTQEGLTRVEWTDRRTDRGENMGKYN